MYCKSNRFLQIVSTDHGTHGTLNHWNFMCAALICSVMSDSIQPRGLEPARLSVHGILQARILEWLAMPSSRGSSQPRNQIRIPYVSFIGRWFFLFFVFFFTTSVTWEAHLELYSCIFLTWLFIEIDCPFSGQLLHFLSTKRLKALLICIQFSSVAQLTLCNPMDYSTPGFPVRHQLPELAQTHVYGVGDAIQLSHPLCPLLLLPSIFPSFRVFSNSFALGKI